MAQSPSENIQHAKDYHVSSVSCSEDGSTLPATDFPFYNKFCTCANTIDCHHVVRSSMLMAATSGASNEAGAAQEPPSSSSQGSSSGASKGRWKLESEDSSYDSDYENSELLSPQGEGFPSAGEDDPLGSAHDEVSRTVSDTLAAEFAEYVSMPVQQTLGRSNEEEQEEELDDDEDEEEEEKEDDATMEAILLDPNYTSRVEFALKLGYTERQVQIALQKLGPQPGQNELLAELIKLGATVATPRATDTPSSTSLSSSTTTGAPTADEGHLSADEILRVGDNRQGSRPDQQDGSGTQFRSIVIDGSNVAMSHGNKEVFSCRGIKLCVDWFKSRGHKEITVFVPKWRKEVSRPDARITDQDILLELEKERRLVFTPSRFVGGRRLVCYDDRYILKLAAATDGIVVSNDNYRDLANENPEYKKVVEERLLMYSFVNDRFMPPDDPLGRHGPSLDNFLRKPSKALESTSPPCPYGKKCTYGNKCKYYHPERGNQPQKSVTERLVEQAKIQIQEVKARGNKSRDSSPGDSLKLKLTSTMSAPASSESKPVKKLPLSRTKSVVSQSMLPKDLIEGSATSKKDEMKPAEKEESDKDFAGAAESSMSKLPRPVGNFDIPTTNYGSFPQKTLINNPWNHPQAWSHMGMMPPMPTMSSNPSASRLFSGDQGGHLSVAKRLSDPENKPEGGGEGPNLHRKLQRQLTLNPTCDPRLYQIHNYIPSHHMPMAKAPGLKSTCSLDSDHESVMSRSIGLGMESRDPSLTVGGHRPLTRHNSATESHCGASPIQSQVCWEKNPVISMAADSIHTTVTRIASAPDSYCQWPSSQQRIPPMQRLNSTSDTQLNLYHDNSSASYFSSSIFEPEQQHQHHSWSLQNQAHLGSPRQWHHEAPTNSIPRPQTPLSHLSQPLRPSSVPPHQASLPPTQINCGDDLRSRLYFHLSSIFPQEQVRAAMMMYPEDVDVTPQQLCATILSMFPPRNQ